MNVFSLEKMKKSISSEVLSKLNETPLGEPISLEIAEHVALAIKNWATEKGITHYCYLYYPIFGHSAFKKESIFKISENHELWYHFSGKNLTSQSQATEFLENLKQRDTFEARGYRIWDHASPLFTLDKTLYIPTIFSSYHGEALDYKTLLIRSLKAIDDSTVAICQYFDKEIQKVNTTLGWEQEFYLIPYEDFKNNKELGDLDEVIFMSKEVRSKKVKATITNEPVIKLFFEELELECRKLGILIQTMHSETGPYQFECASTAEETNLSVDQNLIFCQMVEFVAEKHKLKPIFKEKPFPKFSGSSKHLNWSIKSDKGKNLLSTGSTPRNNIRFLTFFVNVLKALNDHYEKIASSSINYHNEQRLGKHDAPPATIQVYIGPYLESILDDLEKRIDMAKMSEDEKSELKLDFGKIPESLIDITDTARTSPIAFTGNKFELRLPGASLHPARALIVFNTIVAHQFKEYDKSMQKLINEGHKKDEAIFIMLKKYIKESKKILYNGNCYENNWENEMKKKNIKININSFEANQILNSAETKKIFKETHVFSNAEHEIFFHKNFDEQLETILSETEYIYSNLENNIIPLLIEELKETMKTKAELTIARMPKEIMEEVEDRLRQNTAKLILFNDLKNKYKKSRELEKNSITKTDYENLRILKEELLNA